MSSSEECQLCNSCDEDINLYGRKNVLNSTCVHNYCCLFSSGLYQNGDVDDELQGFHIEDINKEVCRARKLSCTFCKKRGASIGCAISSCSIKYHFNCGLSNNILYEYFDQYRSYCKKHKPMQNKNLFIQFDLTTSICAICLSNFDKTSYVIASACCKDCFFHKSCIQNYAYSSGLHFFKCPKCSNSDNFKLEMLTCGICIPDRDAQWEVQEVSYFRNLENLRFVCDVIECKSSLGRNENLLNTEWEIMRCDDCGYNGTHLFCSDLKTAMDPWICQECSSLTSKVGDEQISHFEKPNIPEISSENTESPKSLNNSESKFFFMSPICKKSFKKYCNEVKKQVDIRSYFVPSQSNQANTLNDATPLSTHSFSKTKNNSLLNHQNNDPFIMRYHYRQTLPNLKAALNTCKNSLKKLHTGKISKMNKHYSKQFNIEEVLLRFALLTGDVKLLPSTKIFCVL